VGVSLPFALLLDAEVVLCLDMDVNLQALDF